MRHDSPGRLPFFCECGMESCRHSVWLTLREARDVIQSGELIIGAHFFQELEARASLAAAGHATRSVAYAGAEDGLRRR